MGDRELEITTLDGQKGRITVTEALRALTEQYAADVRQGVCSTTSSSRVVNGVVATFSVSRIEAQA